MGAWIETYCKNVMKVRFPVAPLVGAWIETSSRDVVVRGRGRTPRGCVD